jgi:hypothetical protein
MTRLGQSAIAALNTSVNRRLSGKAPAGVVTQAAGVPVLALATTPTEESKLGDRLIPGRHRLRLNSREAISSPRRCGCCGSPGCAHGRLRGRLHDRDRTNPCRVRRSHSAPLQELHEPENEVPTRAGEAVR